MRPRAFDRVRCQVQHVQLAVAALATVSASCAAQRTFSVRSDPSDAIVRIDDRVVGRTPYDEKFDAYGKRRVTLYKEGYRTLSTLVDLDAPWYGVFPLDIFSEVLFPFGWRDPHELRVVLERESGGVSAPDLDKVIEKAESVRLAGPEGPRTLPPRPKAEPIAPVLPAEPEPAPPVPKPDKP